MKELVIRRIEKEKIITIVRGVPRESLIPLAEAMYEGGICLIECTYDATGRASDEETAAGIAMLTEHFGDRMAIGAGTVLSTRQAELTRDAGGCFIISPDTNPEVIKRTAELDMVSIPGALTPTEVTAAYRAGADFVKLFPVNVMGSGYIKDIKAPLSHVRLLAVGGINEKNMREYLDAGAVGIGVGSGIVNKRMITEGDFDGIAALARSYVENR